ncbi:MAG: hypothetical protein OXR03_25160 [Rhodospirillaceae bacterium]|nr:hypothetical protein [Rhodospirillaceae bacterium]MDD9929129.1 hypothetical protein [Rhodospirillaceae bacterium]
MTGQFPDPNEIPFCSSNHCSFEPRANGYESIANGYFKPLKRTRGGVPLNATILVICHHP